MAQLKLSVCIEMLFNNLDLLERPAAVAKVGLPAFEIWGWKNKPMDDLKAAGDAAGLRIAAMSLDPGVPLVDPELTAKFIAAAPDGINEAKRLGVPTLLVTTGQEMDLPREVQHASIVAGLKGIASMIEDAGITLVLEPLNILVDHKGYYLDTSDEGFQILDEVGCPSIKLLYDIYHQQITEGNLINRITARIGQIGHFHVADVPGRAEPGTGEINYTNVFAAIAATDYDCYVGLEHRASTTPEEALAKVKQIAGV